MVRYLQEKETTVKTSLEMQIKQNGFNSVIETEEECRRISSLLPIKNSDLAKFKKKTLKLKLR